MNPSEFKKAWVESGEGLQPISLPTLNKFPLSEEARSFLNIAGLPESAAPFLNFVGDDTDSSGQSIGRLTSWFDHLEKEFNRYIVIGSDGSGDIIALNTQQDCMVVWLDHEADFHSRFMNSSINQMAASLLAYHEFVQIVIVENGEDAYLDSKFTKAQLADLHTKLKQIDARAVSEGFWNLELQGLMTDS